MLKRLQAVLVVPLILVLPLYVSTVVGDVRNSGVPRTGSSGSGSGSIAAGVTTVTDCGANQLFYQNASSAVVDCSTQLTFVEGGALTVAGGIIISGGSFAGTAGKMYQAAATGLTFIVPNGSTSDWLLADTAGTGIFGVEGTSAFFGNDTQASPRAFTLRGESGAGTDIAGGRLNQIGGLGTGNAVPGALVLQTGSAGATGTTLQTARDRVFVEGRYKALTAASATAVVRIAIPQGEVSGGSFEYTVEANDGTDFQARSGRTQWQAVNKTGTETCVLGFTTEVTDGSALATSEAVPTSLTYTLTCVSNAADTVDIEINAASGLTETVLRATQWVLRKNGGTGAVTAQ